MVTVRDDSPSGEPLSKREDADYQSAIQQTASLRYIILPETAKCSIKCAIKWGAKGRSGGFSLVELLLAVAVMVMLIGAVVFSFSTLLAGSQLDEGVTQFGNLVRLARAHAGNTGRRVQLNFKEEVTADGAVVGNPSVTWEPDPVTNPGRFQKLWEVTPVIESVNEFVAIDSSRRSGTDEASPQEGEPREWSEAGAEAPPWLTPVMFYADGSADSAEIVLVSRDRDDTRRVVLHIEGITGALRRETSPSDTVASTTGKDALVEEAR